MDLKSILSEIELSESEKKGIHQLKCDAYTGNNDFVWQCECFLIGWLKDKLVSAGRLDAAVLAVLGDQIQKRMPFLQEMLIGQSETYHDFIQRVSPYLMYMGDKICYGALKSFSIELGKALEKAGYQVIYVQNKDMTREFFASIAGRTFRGLIAFQNPSFTLKTTDGRYLHDLVDTPLYWMDFDNPCWYGSYIRDMPQKTKFLCVDRYYVSYIRNIQHRTAFFFPPAADPSDISSLLYDDFVIRKREMVVYPLTFVGTCSDRLDENLAIIHQQQPTLYPLALEYVDRMIAEYDKSQDVVLAELLSDVGIMQKYFNRSEPFTDEEFDQFLQSWAFIGKDVVHHLRKKVVRTILDAGIELHVFSDTFEEFSDYTNLHIHPSVDYEETSDIYRKSLISLNVMTGHKAGVTERIANSMLCGALSFTEGTEYIDEEFCEGVDIETFRLTNDDIAGIPDRIKALLSDEDAILRIAYRGMRKALQDHTWDKRVEEFNDMFYRSHTSA